jgi:hypothetical protein
MRSWAPRAENDRAKTNPSCSSGNRGGTRVARWAFGRGGGVAGMDGEEHWFQLGRTGPGRLDDGDCAAPGIIADRRGSGRGMRQFALLGAGRAGAGSISSGSGRCRLNREQRRFVKCQKTGTSAHRGTAGGGADAVTTTGADLRRRKSDKRHRHEECRGERLLRSVARGRDHFYSKRIRSRQASDVVKRIVTEEFDCK